MVDSRVGKDSKLPKLLVKRWLGLSLLVSVLFSILSLVHAFSSAYIIQDDARHHVFWMHRFLDPELFPNDLIADYFQAVAPLGYVGLYKIFAVLHVDPITLNKLLPFGLGLIMTAYCFGLCMELLPLPIAGFISTVLLNELIWAEDNLISATPRAFVYPIFLGFLYYFMRRSLWPCLLMILLQGLFYPQYALIIIVFLFVFFCSQPQYFFQNGQLSLAFLHNPAGLKDFKLCLSGISLACAILLVFKLTSGGFGPVVTLAEAKQMLEFTDAGRFPFFDDNPWCFWVSKKNSGLLAAYNATRDCEFYVGAFPIGFPPFLWVSVFLPVLLKLKPLDTADKESNVKFNVLLCVFISSLMLFLTAHAMLLTLHLPARYTVHSFRILMAVSAGISLTLMARWVQDLVSGYFSNTVSKNLGVGLWTFFLIVAIAFPFLTPNFATKAFVQGQEPGLYAFMASQPKDILVASFSQEADNIPILSKRSVLINRENAIPFHHGFYDEFSQRAHDLLEAQYTPKYKTLKAFIQTYGIDFWVIDDDAYDPTYLEKRWVQQYQPTFRQSRGRLLQSSSVSALEQMVSSCTVFKGDRVTVIDAKCIVQKR